MSSSPSQLPTAYQQSRASDLGNAYQKSQATTSLPGSAADRKQQVVVQFLEGQKQNRPSPNRTAFSTSSADDLYQQRRIVILREYIQEGLNLLPTTDCEVSAVPSAVNLHSITQRVKGQYPLKNHPLGTYLVVGSLASHGLAFLVTNHDPCSSFAHSALSDVVLGFQVLAALGSFIGGASTLKWNSRRVVEEIPLPATKAELRLPDGQGTLLTYDPTEPEIAEAKNFIDSAKKFHSFYQKYLSTDLQYIHKSELFFAEDAKIQAAILSRSTEVNPQLLGIDGHYRSLAKQHVAASKIISWRNVFGALFMFLGGSICTASAIKTPTILSCSKGTSPDSTELLLLNSAACVSLVAATIFLLRHRICQQAEAIELPIS